MNPFAWSFRTQFFAGVLVCAFLLGYALYAQYRLFLDPCPLCIFQRVVFIVMGLVFLLGALHGPKGWGRKVYGVLVFVVAMIGVGIAGRHVWLQNLPADQVPACGPGLSYMLDAFPMSKTLSMVFTGSGECANVDWHFLGLTMPTWTLICYVLLGAGALWAGLRRR
jgi:disulfide bond formation protein DsbB